MGRAIGAGILWLFLGAAFAQENIPDRPMNEFRHEGGSLVCFTDAGDSKGYLPCLRIGNLVLDMTVGEMEAEIKKSGGRFEETHLGKGGAETRLYSFPVSEGTRDPAHLLVSFFRGKAEAIQLAGKGAAVTLAFSSVQLGDDPLQVVRLIGPAFATERDPETGEIFWDYDPFPFRIGFKDGRVRSIFVQKGD